MFEQDDTLTPIVSSALCRADYRIENLPGMTEDERAMYGAALKADQRDAVKAQSRKRVSNPRDASGCKLLLGQQINPDDLAYYVLVITRRDVQSTPLDPRANSAGVIVGAVTRRNLIGLTYAEACEEAQAIYNHRPAREQYSRIQLIARRTYSRAQRQPVTRNRGLVVGLSDRMVQYLAAHPNCETELIAGRPTNAFIDLIVLESKATGVPVVDLIEHVKGGQWKRFHAGRVAGTGARLSGGARRVAERAGKRIDGAP